MVKLHNCDSQILQQILDKIYIPNPKAHKSKATHIHIRIRLLEF